ncbi:hypothetical protein LJC08_04120 [Methanimicrococcus sp. OttesenSCG-928-J09]|nr:hypothetical protein [Methanimicrococcus sp. OttesenSCG-928-J09]
MILFCFFHLFFDFFIYSSDFLLFVFLRGSRSQVSVAGWNQIPFCSGREVFTEKSLTRFLVAPPL